jgi:hypothetical protein
MEGTRAGAELVASSRYVRPSFRVSCHSSYFLYYHISLHQKIERSNTGQSFYRYGVVQGEPTRKSRDINPPPWVNRERDTIHPGSLSRNGLSHYIIN